MLMKSFDAIAIFIIGLVLFTFGLYSQEIIGFESRFYLFAQEMWRHGASWFPTTYQKPYPDYPATSTFLIYSIANIFGSLNKLTAVLPSAIASAATLSVTYLIGELQNRAWGWAAAIFLLFTMTFVVEARTISLDQYITLITTLSFYIACRNKNTGFIIPLFILGFAIRGPIGVVIPAGVLCVFYLLDKNYKRFFVTGFSAVFVLVFCTLIFLNVAYHVGGQAFVQDVLRMEVGSRMHDAKMPPVWFYFTESFGGFAVVYPLAILTMLGFLPYLFKTDAATDVKFLRKLLAWALVIIIGLSIPADKKLRYILPFAPALALICGGLFYSLTRNKYLLIVRKMFRCVCLFFPVLALLVIGYGYYKHIELGINYPILVVLFLVLQIDMFFSRKHTLMVLGLAALSFYVALTGIVEVINLSTNATHDFVLNIENMRQKQHSKLIFFQEGADGMPIKYLVNMPKEESPVYLQRVDELTALPAQTIVVVGAENISHVPEGMFKVNVKGKIGHDDVVVLQKLQ